MTRLGAFASLPHYWRHIAPVVSALADRGVPIEALASRQGSPWGGPLGAPVRGRTMIVASWADAARVAPEPFIYVEHGAGQTYVDAPAAHGWAGAAGLEGCRLFLCPNETVAARWRATYPSIPAAVVGCPALDEFHVEHRPLSEVPRIGFTWHWLCAVAPEARSALPFYAPALPAVVAELMRDGFEVVGHAHPRIARRARAVYERAGIRWVDLAEFLWKTDVVVADNTSVMYEAASVGASVVALNAPWYRRDVEHGLRFWDLVPGDQCDGPADLVESIEFAHVSPADDLRDRAAAFVYADRTGGAAALAAAAILEVIDGRSY